MAADDTGEKTEQPTPRRRSEAREEGQAPRSNDLSAAIVLLTGLVLLNLFGAGIYAQMLALIHDLGDMNDPSTATLTVWIRRAAYGAAMMLLPFLSILFVIALAGGLAQTGALLAWKKLIPKLDHISPLKGIKRIFSTDSLVRAAMGVLKMLLVAAVAYYSVIGQIQPVLGATTVEPVGIVDMASRIVFSLAMRMALVLLILGLVDYFYQRWKVEKGMKMTKQDVKDELKRMEGDPLLKQRRRQMQMKLAMQRLAIDVPRADVVVTNPTEYSVALRYDEQTMSAPRMIAKGKDFLALRIRQIAHQHGVPVVQRPPLARGLYAAVDVGQEVPALYFRAVAELLAYVYQITGKAAG